MIVFPALDLIAGHVVRLERGRRDHCTVYSTDPVAVAQRFIDQGAQWLHVVDLSAAFEEDDGARAANNRALARLCALDHVSIDVGGGVRSQARVDELVELGADRIALGTLLMQAPTEAHNLVQKYGSRLVADVAARANQVQVNGWRDTAHATLDSVISRVRDTGFQHLVYTDIARDGMQTGIDVAAYEHVAREAGFPLVASGGISSLDNIRSLAAAGSGVVEGVIVGRALYEHAFSVADALTAACSVAN